MLPPKQLLDAGTGAVLVAVGIAVSVESLRLGIAGQYGPGPGFLPAFLGVGLGVSGAILGGRALVTDVGSLEVEIPDRAALKQVVLANIGLLIAVLAFEPLGFPIATALLAFYCVIVLARRSVLVASVTAIAMAASSYLVFNLALGVGLPTGPLPLP